MSSFGELAEAKTRDDYAKSLEKNGPQQEDRPAKLRGVKNRGIRGIARRELDEERINAPMKEKPPSSRIGGGRGKPSGKKKEKKK